MQGVQRWEVGLYKILFFLFMIAFLLTVDGTLAYDILDFRIDTVFEWLVLIMIFGIVGAIFIVDQGKKGAE